MEMMCVCSFGRFGKIKGISFNKIYKVKFHFKEKVLISNDFGKPQMVDRNNFVSYNNIKRFL